MSDDKLRSAAADVVGAFESLGRTSDAAGLLVSRSRCEAAMLKLSAALKDGHGVGMPAAPQPLQLAETSEPVAYLHYASKKPSERRLSFVPIPTKQERASGWVTVVLWDIGGAAPQPQDEAVAARLFAAIAHGDDTHRAWLRDALAAFFAGRPVPAVAPQPPAQAACDCGDVYPVGSPGAAEIASTGRCPGCNAEADAKSDHLVDANKMIADAVAAERERWQHVARAAQEVTTGGEDKIDAFEVPSHLIAALALALDEAPAKAAPVAQPQQEQAAKAWAEGYRAGIDDERTSEDNIGIAGFGAKVQPARNNPYRANAAPVAQPHNLTLLAEAANLFRSYEQLHRARGPEHLEKAERNAEIAGRIEAALTAQISVTHPLTREQIESMRRDGMEPDEYPEPWAYARGVRDAELAHGIGKPAAGELARAEACGVKPATATATPDPYSEAKAAWRDGELEVLLPTGRNSEDWLPWKLTIGGEPEWHFAPPERFRRRPKPATGIGQPVAGEGGAA